MPNDFEAEDVEVIIISNSKEYFIPQWQIDEVRERTENFINNPKSASKYEDFLKEFEDEF